MHFSQLELGVLELGDALAKLDTLLGVLDGLIHGTFAQTQSCLLYTSCQAFYIPSPAGSFHGPAPLTQ